MLLASAATAVAIALAGCDTETLTRSDLRAKQPLSPQIVAEIEKNDMSKDSPVLIRIFKEEAELEVWKQKRDGRFALLKTYPICRWSGELGPKIKEGDRQAPEGFYTIAPGQMNPLSNYYLAFNMGYPNAFDRAHGRTGSQLMVHGDCSSRGCYAMTDEQIGEIYALAREAFFGGQRAFQVQAYPFRMTPLNMAKHRNNPNMAFWKMLKRGYDHFEVTHLEPKVDVCEKRYVFNAEPPAGSTRPLNFSAAGRCPAYQVQRDIAEAVQNKQRRDEIRTAQLIARGTRAAPIRTAVDGGMHRDFVAGLKDKGTMRNGGPNYTAVAAIESPDTPPVIAAASPEPVRVSSTGSIAAADVPIPRAAPQPKSDTAAPEERSIASRIGGLFGFASDDNERAAKTESTRVASSSSSLFSNLFSSSDKAGKRKSDDSNGVLDRIGRTIGLRGTKQQAADAAPATRPNAPAARPTRTASAGANTPPARPKPRPEATAAAAPADSKAPQSETAKPAANAATIGTRPNPAPLDNNNGPSVQTASNGAQANPSLVSGAAPVIPTGSFNTRWYGAN
jgi:murein L,D-transpeptidase YafK